MNKQKKCIICGKKFEQKTNKIYCSEECRRKAYGHYCFSTPEAQERYREKVMEQEGLNNEEEFNYFFRERTAANKGMTTTEYNAYLEERKASKLGISVQELRHCTYLAKKNKTSLFEELGMEEEEYKERMKRKWRKKS